jgi:transcriptional regulator with XRE-family HTH domain
MFKKKDLIITPEYWMETIQDEVFRQLTDYMKREELNKTELAGRLNVSKGYISQMLNGAFNFTLKKLIEIALSIGKVPYIKFITPEEYLAIEREAKRKGERDKSINDLHLREQFEDMEATLKRIEELKEYSVDAYNYCKESYVMRLRFLLKSIQAENTRVELFVHEVKSPDLYTFRINNRPATALNLVSLLRTYHKELHITNVENGLSISYIAETLRNAGENVQSQIDFNKLTVSQN